MFPSRIPASPVVKSTVKSALQGKRISATIAALIPVFTFYMLYLIMSSFSFILTDALSWILLTAMAVLFLFVLNPVLLGAIRFFWRLTDGADDGPAEVFYYFGSFFRYKRAMKSIFLMIFKCFTALFTCLLPYIIITILSEAWLYQFLGTEIPLWVAGLALVQSFLRVVGIFAGLAVISRYYLFPAIVVMDDSMLLLEALHISVMVSRRSVSYFLGLAVSLFGWILLSLLVAPLIYTAPLFLGCYAVHCRYALVNYNLSLDFYANESYNNTF